MALAPYTSTYTDINTNIMDSDDLVNEFLRIKTFLDEWSASIETIGTVNIHEETVTITETDIGVDPSDGLMQKRLIADNIESVAVAFGERADAATYRVYLSLRFQNKSTTFTVNGPSGQTHLFGVNRTEYVPSQEPADGYYTALVIATYGTNGLIVNVFANNTEADEVDSDDILTAVAT